MKKCVIRPIPHQSRRFETNVSLDVPFIQANSRPKRAQKRNLENGRFFGRNFLGSRKMDGKGGGVLEFEDVFVSKKKMLGS